MDRGARWAAVHGVAKNWTRLKLISTHRHTDTDTYVYEREKEREKEQERKGVV